MKIEFSYQANPGLRIIQQIDKGKIVWIRGYNGVGKSLAAKLLEIISGGHVFDSRSEFASLMNSLHRAKITITKNSGEKLRIVLEPKKWVFDESTRMIKHESVGTFYEKNEIITAQRFGSEFNARIIRGNESLPTQISALIIQSLDQFRAYGTSCENILNLSKNFRDMIEEELELRAVDDFDKIEKRLAENADNIKQGSKEMRVIERNVKLVSKLLEIQKDIHLHNEYTTVNLTEKIRTMEKKLKRLVAEQGKLQEERYEHSYKSRDLIKTESVRYDALIRSMRRAKAEQDDISSRMYSKFGELGIEFMPEKGLLKRVRGKFQYLREEEQRINKEKKQERIVDEVLTKQSHISSALTDIEPDLDVSNEIIAHGKVPALDGEIDISISELQDMIKIQESILLEKKKEASFKDYDKELEWIVDQQEKLNDIKRLQKQRSRIEKRISGLEATLKSLVVSDRTEYDKHLGRIAELDEKIRTNQINTAKTNDALGFLRNTYDKIQATPSLNRLIAQKDGMLEKLDLELDETSRSYLNERLEELKGLSTLKFKELGDLESDAIYLQHKRLELKKSFERKITKLKKDRKFTFLTQWLKENASDKPIDMLRRLSKNLEGFVNTIGEFNLRIVDIQRYHQELIKILAQRATELSEEKDVERLEEIFNNRLREFYSRDIFMRYVFEGFEKIKAFDLRRNQISLVDTKTNIQSKPISSFSTGQKAFAFSISMMSLVFSKPSKERVLFLDEFGALLDYLREDILLEQVQTKVLAENIVQKIVILLPVRERLEEVLQNLRIQKQSAVSREEHTRLQKEIRKYSDRLNQLKERGYYQET